MKILAIALNTFREAVRDRVLYLILAFAVVLILASVLLGMKGIVLFNGTHMHSIKIIISNKFNMRR